MRVEKIWLEKGDKKRNSTSASKVCEMKLSVSCIYLNARGLGRIGKNKPTQKNKNPRGFPRKVAAASDSFSNSGTFTGALIAVGQVFRQLTLLSPLGPSASGATHALSLLEQRQQPP